MNKLEQLQFVYGYVIRRGELIRSKSCYGNTTDYEGAVVAKADIQAYLKDIDSDKTKYPNNR